VLTEERFRLEFRRATESLTNRFSCARFAATSRHQDHFEGKGVGMTEAGERGRRKVRTGVVVSARCRRP